MGTLSSFCALLQYLLGKIVPYFGVVPQHFVVGKPQQLRVALAQLLPDTLLYAWIVQFALSGRLARNEFINGIADSSLRWSCSAIDRENIRNLPSFKLADDRKCCL